MKVSDDPEFSDLGCSILVGIAIICFTVYQVVSHLYPKGLNP